MSSKQILTSIDPIAVAARAALERNREMLDRADSIALAPKRLPEITLPDPESVREVEYDPDSVAASILLGEGTGSLPADLAIGLTGGAAGPITEAVGGKSGVLDWIPGGSLAKAAVIAAPRASSILRRVAGTTAQDEAVDVIKTVAERIVRRLSRSNTPVTPEDIRLAAIEESADLGNISGLSNIRLQAGNLAERTLNRAIEAIEGGNMPNISVLMPNKIDVSYRALDDEARKELTRNANTITYHHRAKDFYETLGPEEKAAIEELATEVGDRAVAKALQENPAADLNKIRRDAIYRTRIYEAGKRMTAENRKLEPEKKLNEIQSGSEFGTADEREAVSQVGIEAYHRALELALQEGLSQTEAAKLARTARSRAMNQYIKSSGGKLAEDRLNADKLRSQNARFAYNLFSPDIKNEISSAVEETRNATRAEYLKSGATATEATRAAGRAAQSKKTSETRRILHEMGFKSANDPRIKDFSMLNKNGTHVRNDGSVGGLEPISASRILSGALDITDNDRMMQAAYDAGIGEKPLFSSETVKSPTERILEGVAYPQAPAVDKYEAIRQKARDFANSRIGEYKRLDPETFPNHLVNTLLEKLDLPVDDVDIEGNRELLVDVYRQAGWKLD